MSDVGLSVGAAWIAGQDRSMWRTLRPSAGQAQQWVSEWVSEKLATLESSQVGTTLADFVGRFSKFFHRWTRQKIGWHLRKLCLTVESCVCWLTYSVIPKVGLSKLKSRGYPLVNAAWSYSYQFWRITSVWRTDGWTDDRADTATPIPIPVSALA